MRLLLILISALLFLPGRVLNAQEANAQEVDARFVFNYYEQEGEHSAVTGGIGTQELQDRSLDISLSIPIDTNNTLRLFSHINYYSSASSDKIDYNISSASSDDIRLQVQLGFSRKDKSGAQSSLDLGNSLESDYLSRYILGQRNIPFADKRGEVSIDLGLYFDHWALITADELRVERQFFETDRRNTYQLGLSVKRNVSDRIQLGIAIHPVFQHGLLSTPFHRVIDANDSVVAEYFPSSRFRFPFTFSLDAAIFRNVFLNTSYRFYADDFGVIAHSASIGIPVYLNGSLDLTPFFRYHKQNAARFFYPYGKTPSDAEFRSSDFDLSELSSFKLGLAINKQINPSSNLSQTLNEISLRSGIYQRTDGLKSVFVTMGFRLLFRQKKRL